MNNKEQCGACNNCNYIIISALREIVPVLYCSTDDSLTQDLCNFLDENLCLTIPISDMQSSTTDVNISSDTDISNVLSVFQKTLVLLTDRCSTPFNDTVQKLLRLQEINRRVCLFFCDTETSYMGKFKEYCLRIFTNNASIKLHALNFLRGMF